MGPDLVTGMDKLVGQQGVVTEELSSHNPGRVEARPDGRPAHCRTVAKNPLWRQGHFLGILPR